MTRDNTSVPLTLILGLATLVCMSLIGCGDKPEKSRTAPPIIGMDHFDGLQESVWVSYRALFNDKREIVAIVLCYWQEGLAEESDTIRVVTQWPPEPEVSGLWLNGERVCLAETPPPAVFLLLAKQSKRVIVTRIDGELSEEAMAQLIKFSELARKAELETLLPRLKNFLEEEVIEKSAGGRGKRPSD